MKSISIELEEQIYNEAQAILNDYGLDVEGVIKSTLKRIVRQGSAEFIFAKQGVQAQTEHAAVENIDTKPLVNGETKFIGMVASTPATPIAKITKTIAKSYFAKRGYVFDAPVIFSSRNKATSDYWANPSINTVRGKWYLILNDQYQRILRLFLIDCENGMQSLKENPYNNTQITAKETLNDMLRLVPRADKPELINLQILGDDIIRFTDKISGVEFRPYLIDEINY